MFRTVFSTAFAVTATALILMATFSQPADARRAGCAYVARDVNNVIVSIGTAKAAKRKWACNRARRRCDRARSRTKLNRGRLPISGCSKL